jgi:hypothetical protein
LLIIDCYLFRKDLILNYRALFWKWCKN